MISSLPPLSLYIHIPWCVKKCPYCDFNSHVKQEGDESYPEQAYLSQLKLDLGGDLNFVQGRKIKSIFFGGGTPSLMSEGFYSDLIDHLSNVLEFEDTIEITLEANPGTTEIARFIGYRAAGINRLSIGVQSFDDIHLKKLGRIHSGSGAVRAIEQAQMAGFDNFNIDLMHGLEGQTPVQANADLRQAIGLGPSHLSWYQLTIEQNTEFFRRPPKLPEDETLWRIQQEGVEILESGGFQQYEVSAYSTQNREAKHNLNYWTFGDYIGLGAGAHSKITLIDAGSNDSERILRYRKTRAPADYLKPKPLFRVAEESINPEDLGFEFLMNTLRLNRGVSEALFVERTGLPLAALEPELSELRRQGLIEKGHLGTTPKGHLFLNSVLEKFAGTN